MLQSNVNFWESEYIKVESEHIKVDQQLNVAQIEILTGVHVAKSD